MAKPRPTAIELGGVLAVQNHFWNQASFDRAKTYYEFPFGMRVHGSFGALKSLHDAEQLAIVLINECGYPIDTLVYAFGDGVPMRITFRSAENDIWILSATVEEFVEPAGWAPLGLTVTAPTISSLVGKIWLLLDGVRCCVFINQREER